MVKVPFLFIVFFLIGACWAVVHAAGSGYPDRPITVIVPVPPGGSTDIGARLLAQFMEKQLRQPVVVVNRPGAAGTIGGYALSSAKPDGYTLGYFPSSTAVPEIFSYFYSAPYSSSDLRPICRVHVPIITISVKVDAPWNSLKELVEFARKNPSMKFGHIGKSTTQYLMIKTLANAENLRIVDVPFDGDGTMVPALLGGHVPVATPVLSVIKPMLEGKKLKAFSVWLQTRAPSVPDIPAMPEFGYKIPYVPFQGFYAPKETPDEVIKKIDEVVRKVTEDKEFQDKNKAMDMVVEYEDTTLHEKYLLRYKTNVQVFLREEGLVKK
jgi:tripartite-type tricarboxylate transporter receptor subunit TctC